MLLANSLFLKKIKEKLHLILLSSCSLLIFLLPGINLIATMIFVNDKEAHVSFFMLLAMYRMLDGKNYQNIIFQNILLGVLIELCQSALPNRSCDFNDIIADSIGTLFGYFFRVGFDKMPKAYLQLVLPTKISYWINLA